MNLQSLSRKLVVLAFAATLLVGLASTASAQVTINHRPDIILIGDEEPVGKPGHGMISIMDTIMVRVTLSPGDPDSIDHIVVDLRKYGGDEVSALATYQGRDAFVQNVAWVPVCSVTGTANADVFIVHEKSTLCPTDTWVAAWDAGVSLWEIAGFNTGTVGTVVTGTTFHWEPAPGDTVFSFVVTDTLNICCNVFPTDCDHFEWETFEYIPPDTVWTDTLVVSDADSFWIDNTPCEYIGHDDPTVLVTAYMTAGYTDTCTSNHPVDVYDNWVDWDTHWTTYIVQWPRLYPVEFQEHLDYYFRFITDNAGWGNVFDEPDNILNPASCLSPTCDVCSVYVDTRKLAHENGNDDILWFAWDAYLFGGTYQDTNWYHVGNPYYAGIDCPTEDNGVTGIFNTTFNILQDSVDVGPGEQLPMIWISDSGDTTWFGNFSNTLLAIDNQVPGWNDLAVSDSVMPWDIMFEADMTLAGSSDVLNPASEGNPTPDWLQVKLDMAGMHDLDDVVDGGRAFASMMYAGYYAGADYADTSLKYMVEMFPLSPIWGTPETDVIACPPSPYCWDQDSIWSWVHVFDNAGNSFCVGGWDTTFAVDNILPFVDAGDCTTNLYIWTEISEDVAFKTGYANVGMPEDNIHGNEYVDRDRIVLHANLGDALGVDEVLDVTLINNPYCNDPVPFLYDDGLSGGDPVMGDKNFTGHTRIQVAGITADVCTLDTDELEQGFEVLVTDDAGNAAINASCIQPKVDNEPPWMSPEHVAIIFWDDPETFGIDGDKDGDGIVTIGDELIFEWRAQDEVIEDGEIDSVRVNLASIDPDWTGWLNLWWQPPGGIYRNWWPNAGGGGDPDTSLFVVPAGSVDGEELCADFKVWDNAGNTNGWENFCSGLTLDNASAMITCADFDITISGADTVASVGDTVCFTYAGPDDDVEDIAVHAYGVAGADSIIYLVKNGAWTGCFVVEEGMIDNPAFYFSVHAEDDVGNEYWCSAGPIAVDNQVPSMACGNAYVRLWDYVENIPGHIVNVGDNLTAIYFDADGDIVRVTADYANYGTSIGTDGVVELVPEFDGGALYKWGYRVDPLPDGEIDQQAGGLLTLVLLTAYDDAGNSSFMWLCPIWFDETKLPDPVACPSDSTYACDADCLGVDTKRPEPVDPDGITFELLEASNDIANVGDRLRIVVNMGDPTAPGYDMYWEYGFVQADISQYGDEYADLDEYLFLTDRAFSAGGEGDGKFSYHFYYQTAEGYPDGQTLVDGVPILPGEIQLPAGDEGTKIMVRAMDDAGNFSLDWTESDVLVHSVGGHEVPVDNQIPEIEPEDITFSYVDNDENGICDIGDEITITVDMTDAPGGGVAGVWANLYDWGYPSMDKIPLTPSSPVYSITFTAVRNPGNFCEDGVLIEDNVDCEMPRILMGAGLPDHPRVDVVAIDESDNWSYYHFAGPPFSGPFIVEYWPQIEEWPFTFWWSTNGTMDHVTVDTDAPDPVNPTFGDYYESDVRAYSLVDGSIGLKMFYDKEFRNQDVERFFVYGDIVEAGTIDWDTYLGEPIPVDYIPSDFEGMVSGLYAWVSDFLPERDEPYHFALLAVDNAGNVSDKDLTWITGDYADATAPTGFVQAFSEDDHPVDLGHDDSYFLGYLNSDYYEVHYIEWYARIMDIDPMTEGDQPGEWKLVDEDGSWPMNPPYNPLEAPYHCHVASLDCATGENPEDCFDLVPGGCYTFEVCMIPWDTEGNHITADEAEKFVFTYDNWDPVMTYWSVDGHPSPTSERWVVGDEVPIVARGTDGCDMTAELTWELWLVEMDGIYIDMMLDRQTIPVTEDYTFMMDLVNYPAGDLTLGLVQFDEAGNAVSYLQFLEIIDTYAPGGRFAFWKEDAIMLGHFSHPEYLRILDGMHVMGADPAYLSFWVQWPGDVPSEVYDIGHVKIEYQMTGGMDEWTHIATLTEYDDTLTFDGDWWVGYDYEWDTSMFEDGDAVTMKATVMDEVGNTATETVDVLIDSGYPVLVIDIPEAQEVCGEQRVKGPFNVTATETTVPVDTYLAFWAYKRSDEPDVGDCDLFDGSGWTLPADSLMILDLTTPETMWRVTVDPATEGMVDGSWDFVVWTEDVAGNQSWDKNGDWCVDAGYFAEALANGMGMTIVIDNEAPEVRIRTVETDDHVFEPIDQGWLWPMLPYAQCDDQVTVSCWTESDCDVAKVEYWLDDSMLIIGERQMVGSSADESDGYEITFPGSGGLCDYLVPGAMQNGHVTVFLIAELTDVLGNISYYYIDLTMLDIEPASAFITYPTGGMCLSGEVALTSTAINNDELYDVTYEYRTSGSLEDWTHIATTRPHDGAPWDTDINGDEILWNTWGLSGAYDLRAVSRDANLMVDPDPSYITVNVDNEPASGELIVSGDGVLDAGGTLWVGGDAVTLSFDVEDAGCGIECVTFYYKETEQSFDAKVCIGQPDCVPPFAKLWDDCAEHYSFCGVMSGEYQIIAKIESKSGVVTYVEKTVYVDHWSPEGWITQVEDGYNTYDTVSPEDPCCCYDVWGVVEFTGWAEDLVHIQNTVNYAMNSGLNGAQFQYREYDPSGCEYIMLQSAANGNGEVYWTNLGEPIMGDAGPYYTQTWDTGMLVPGYYAVRMVAIDLLGNRADSYCGWAYEPPFVCIQVVDMVPPVAVIAGVDDVTGYVWATYDTHGQDDAAFVRFEYSADGYTWTPIGEIDEETSRGLFGVPWHFATLSGDFWVRAVAFDDDYDPIDNPDLYDKDPAMMLVTIADATVTMAASEMITGLDRWGNLSWCDIITYEAVSAEKPCVIGVFDNDPMDQFNMPWAQWRDQLINPDDPTIWVDHFNISEVDPYGTLTIIATYNDDGIVGAVTDRITLYKVSSIEGTRGYVSQDGMTVSIPAGALSGYLLDGLLMIKVPELIADPSIDDMVAVGGPVMMTLLDSGSCDHYHFDNGVRAHLCMDYDDADIPEGYAEEDLRIAFWDQGGQEWILDGGVEFVNRTVDTENNEVCVYVDQTGTYSVVAAVPLRISTPIFDPRCDDYTGVHPQFCTIIEDLGYGYVDEIMVVLNGPAGDVIYDNMIIYNGGHECGTVLQSSTIGSFDYNIYGAGWYGSYNFVSNTLCMKLVPESMWETYWDYWYGYEDWFLFYGDRISDGLPAGVYTLDIYAQNEAGDEAHVEHLFTVDATAPDVDFKGRYVMADPEFTLTVMDLESGVNTDAIYLDIFGVQPDDEVCCENWVELEDYLGTATPSAIEFDETEGGYVVWFGDMAYGLTLSHGMSIDVIVYDGTFTYGDCEYGDCRQYHNTDGVADCAENHATPVWRRFTVDDESPIMVETSDDSATEVEIEICDELAGVDTDAFMVDGEPIGETDYDWTWTPMNSQCGILRIDVGDDAVDIDLTAKDKAGNLATIEINKGSAAGLDVTGFTVYPVPFDPSVEDVQAKFTLSTGAHVFCKIYDFAGLPVYLVSDDWKEPGTHVLRWLGTDQSGNTVAPGAYIAYIKVDDGTKVVTANLKIAVGGVGK